MRVTRSAANNPSFSSANMATEVPRADDYDDVKVDIEVDGQALEQYPSPEDNEGDRSDRRIRYIEAEEGKTFTILVQCPSDFNWRSASCLNIDVHFDTLFTSCYSWRKNRGSLKCRMSSRKYNDAHTGETKCADFCFQKLTVSESDDPVANKRNLRGLGKIVVTLVRVGTRLITPKTFSSKPAETISSASEKALKGLALSNAVGLTNVRQAPPITRTYDTISLANEVVVEYEFRYRSRRALESLGCLPDPMLSMLEEEEDDVEVVDQPNGRGASIGVDDEIAQLRARLDALEQRRTKQPFANGNRATASSSSAKVKAERVKREPPMPASAASTSARRVRPRLSPNVPIIDLTDTPPPPPEVETGLVRRRAGVQSANY